MTAERIHAPQFQLYKESTIPWAPVIPNHWETKRAKSLFKKMERPVRESDEVVTCFRDGTVTLRRNRRESGFTESLKEIGYQGIRPGDLVIHAMDAFAGAIGVSDSAGKGTPVYSVCTPIGEANPLYYAHALREMSRNKWIESLAKGIRERSSDFRFTEFSAQVVPVPPPEEQAAIVQFLDHAGEQIQCYIASKERLIALLEEERQTLVHQAVTRGLDPNVKLKDSGVEWLGEVPENWEIRRLRYLIQDKLKYGANAQAEFDNPDWPRYLRITDFTEDGRLREDNIRALPPEVAEEYLVEPGDILLARSGATVGKAFLVPTNPRRMCHAGYLIRARAEQSVIDPRFLFTFTQSHTFDRWRRANLIISTIENISAEKYADLPVPTPTISEQRRILEHLEGETRRIDKVSGETERIITLLQEYRTRLIADVVTGQLDVREAAEELPTPEPTEITD